MTASFSDPLLALAFDQALSPQALLDEQDRYLHVNGAWADLLGRRPQDLEGATAADLVDVADRDGLRRALDSARAGGSPPEHVRVRYRAEPQVAAELRVTALLANDDRRVVHLAMDRHAVQGSGSRVAPWEREGERSVLGAFLQAALARSLRYPDRSTVLLRCAVGAVAEADGAVAATVASVVEARLNGTLRRGDLCVRLSGGTWVVVAEVAGSAETRRLADRVRAVLLRPVVVHGKPVPMAVDVTVRLADPTRSAAHLVDELVSATTAAPPRPRGGLEDADWWPPEGAPVQPSRALQVDADPAQPGPLRQQVRTTLHDWARLDVADVAELAVTELSTELLRCGAPAVSVRLECAGGREVRLDVAPAGSAAVSEPSAGTLATGLGLVRRFARRDERYTTPEGVPHLWCELADPDPDDTASPDR